MKPEGHITVGEKRGLILLAVLLLLVTLVLTWRSCSVAGPYEAEAACIDHPSGAPKDTADIGTADASSCRKKARKNGKRSKATPAAPPATRSPRDERVN
ncbi:hypothetical protein [uncultured Duncaniella sp.]|uniref:hypothetical protein n=1 Tax=uncultured Duncaniella sp. TaxID=2768039 RepID=UPI0025FBC1DF|nr:hypothetical protein [uncultured Duncaniella sp.]